jgi:hypothetical protein
MSARKACVAIHMWFADGDGWAYHPKLHGKTFQNIVKGVGKHLHSVNNSESIDLDYEAGKLIGDKSPQEDVKDPKAIRRSPFVLRVAWVPREFLVTLSLETVRKRLKELELPGQRGECKELVISLDPEAEASQEGELVQGDTALPDKPKRTRTQEPNIVEDYDLDQSTYEPPLFQDRRCPNCQKAEAKNDKLGRKIEALMVENEALIVKAASATGKLWGFITLVGAIVALLGSTSLLMWLSSEDVVDEVYVPVWTVMGLTGIAVVGVLARPVLWVIQMLK